MGSNQQFHFKGANYCLLYGYDFNSATMKLYLSIILNCFFVTVVHSIYMR